jgi:protein-S-isoprenylcysteine O-methyltransferase Ste14
MVSCTMQRMRFEPSNIIFLVGFVAYFLIRVVFARHTRGNEKIVRRVDAWERILLSIIIASSLVLPMLYLFTPWLAFANYRLPAWTPWCGTICLLAALWLFWRSHADLGRNWSVTLEMRKGHQLITDGVYRTVRHPMYASIWLFNIAQALLLQNWLAGWSLFLAFGVLYFVRVSREEQMMIDSFGEEYRAYMKRTGRLFPRTFQG